MKYLVRSAKYFLYLCFIFAILVVALSMLGFVEKDIDKMFVNGFDSIWQIALIMAVFAAVYPKFGYTKRTITVPGPAQESSPLVKEYMLSRGYKLEKETSEGLSFRLISPAAKVLRVWEDRITLLYKIDGYELEGKSKDLIIIASGLEARFRGQQDQ